MPDKDEKKALEELLNKVDYEGGWDVFLDCRFSPEDHPCVPQWVMDRLDELIETQLQWWTDVVKLENELLEEYGVEL